MRTLQRTRSRACDVFPLPAVGEKSVISARDQLGSVSQRDPVAGLDRGPVVEHSSLDIVPIGPTPFRAVDLVSNLHFGERFCSPVAHENGGVSCRAVSAGMPAAPVRIHAPAE